jgi:hypothetical protein
METDGGPLAVGLRSTSSSFEFYEGLGMRPTS